MRSDQQVSYGGEVRGRRTGRLSTETAARLVCPAVLFTTLAAHWPSMWLIVLRAGHCCSRAGLRDIIMRNTNIKDLPADIWTATGSMTCAAGSGGAGGSRNAPGHNKLAMSSLLGGTASLDVQPAQDPGWVKVAVTAAGEGWLGFAVADPGMRGGGRHGVAAQAPTHGAWFAKALHTAATPCL